MSYRKKRVGLECLLVLFVLAFSLLVVLSSGVSARQFFFHQISITNESSHPVIDTSGLSNEEKGQIYEQLNKFQSDDTLGNSSIGINSVVLDIKNPVHLVGESLVADSDIRHTEFVFVVSPQLLNTTGISSTGSYLIEFRGVPLAVSQMSAQAELAKTEKVQNVSSGSLSAQAEAVSAAEVKVKTAVSVGTSALEDEHQKALEDINQRLSMQPQLSPPSGNLFERIISYAKLFFFRAFTGFATQESYSLKVTSEHSLLFDGISAQGLTPEQVNSIRQSPYVKRVVPDGIVKADLMDSVPLIGADKVWQLDSNLNMCNASGNDCLTGRGVKIAIIDTGVDYNHPDLGGCLGSGCKVIGGYDFVNGDADPMDDMGHGTHVASIAAGNGALKGVAPDAQILAYKVLNSDGAGYTSTVISGIEKAVDPNGDGDTSDHADIISMSLGQTCFSGDGIYTTLSNSFCGPDDPTSLAVDNAVNSGVVATISAGNAGPKMETIGSPGTARKAITVGAVSKKDYNQVIDFVCPWGTAENGGIPVQGPCGYCYNKGDITKCVNNHTLEDVPDFSSRGPAYSYAYSSYCDYYQNQFGFCAFVNETEPSQIVMKPDVVAPGWLICAATIPSLIQKESGNPYYTPCVDSQHIQLAGTSMAAPHVAGVAALIKQEHPEYSPQQIKDLIVMTAQDLGKPTYEQGAGMVEAYDAVEGKLMINGGLDFGGKVIAGTSYSKDIEIVNRGGDSLTVTLSTSNAINIKDNGLIVNALSFNETTVEIPPYGEENVRATLLVKDSDSLGEFRGFVSFSDGNEVKNVSYHFINGLATLVAAVEGKPDQFYAPMFYVQKNDFSEAKMISSASFTQSVDQDVIYPWTYLFARTGEIPLYAGNYTVYATNVPWDTSPWNLQAGPKCEDGSCAQQPNGYILYQSVELKPGQKANLTFNPYLAKKITFNPVNTAGVKLNLETWREQLVSYTDGVDTCSKYSSLGKSGCEGNGVLQCAWDVSFNTCVNKNLFKISMIDTNNDPYFNTFVLLGGYVNGGNNQVKWLEGFPVVSNQMKNFSMYVSPKTNNFHTDVGFDYTGSSPFSEQKVEAFS